MFDRTEGTMPPVKLNTKGIKPCESKQIFAPAIFALWSTANPEPFEEGKGPEAMAALAELMRSVIRGVDVIKASLRRMVCQGQS